MICVMSSPRIRPLALCVFRKEGSIFISKGYDPKKDETFYRPIGGGIEFGENGRQAVVREVQEDPQRRGCRWGHSLNREAPCILPESSRFSRGSGISLN